MKRKLISFDYALKRLLRSKANFEVLEGFLSELLMEDVKVTQILESESNRLTLQGKQNKVDILVELQNQEVVVIEIQFYGQFDYFHRMLFGTSKVVTEFIESGSEYGTIRKVISINILYFDLGHGEDYIYHGITQFTGIHNKDILNLSKAQEEFFPHLKRVSDIYPEYYILKINGFDDIAKNSLDEWIYFLKNEEIKSEFKAKGLTQAVEALDYMKLTEEEKVEYDRLVEEKRYEKSVMKTQYSEGKREGREEGKREGREEGEKKKTFEIAQNLLDLLTDSQIAEKTGLSIDEVKKLREENLIID